jgi:acetoin utilization protein AcuB
MFISKSMTRKVVTIAKEASILEAREKMTQHGIRHLPVVEDGDLLIGIVTDRDIRSALPFDLFKDPLGEEKEGDEKAIMVGDIMAKEPITVHPSYTIEDALLLIQREKVGAFPVVDEDNRLKGILSVRDLLRAFINVLGIGEPGTLLGILVEEKVGQMKKIVDTITAENIALGSVLVARYWEKDKRAVFPYLLTNNVTRVKKKLKDQGFSLIDPMEWYIDQIS